MSYLDSYNKKKFLEELQDYKDSLLKHPMEASSIISSLIENSTRIEGSTLTKKEVEDLLEYGIEPNKPDHEKAMVRDYSDGLLFVMKQYQKQNSFIHTKFRILESSCHETKWRSQTSRNQSGRGYFIRKN